MNRVDAHTGPAFRPTNLVRMAVFCLAAVMTGVSNAPAQHPADPAPKAQVLVLGTYHFANPDQDYLKTKVDDHLSESRQEQIADVVSLLSKFQPTKIALEAVDGVSPVHRNYNSYLKGEYSLQADERDQLGLRLAKKLGHSRVYAIDHKLDMDVAGVVAEASRSGDRAFLEIFQQVIGELEDFERRKPSMTVRQILAVLNDPQQIRLGREAYLQLARVKSGDRFVGADALASWYHRNFRIFANLMRLIESPHDRVLVIFGSSHAAILTELVDSSPDLRLVDAREFLGIR